MKRFLHIIIAALFLISTSGFIVTEHYCSGNLIDVAINSAPESCCGDDGEGCCSDVQTVHQFKSNYVIPTHEPIDEAQIALLDISSFEILNTETFVDETEVNYNANDPPPLLEEIVYISQFSNLSPPLF